MKNVNWLIETVRQGDNVDFIEPLFMGIQHTMETWPHLSFEYISHVYFWIDLAMPSHARPAQLIYDSLTIKSSSYFYWFLRYWNFRNPPQSDWSRTFWAINQDLHFCQTRKLGWEVNYHNNFPFRLFL